MGEQREKLNLTEELCTRCGLCCHKKGVDYQGVVVFLPEKCRHLKGDNECSIYNIRLEQKYCCSIEDAIKFNALPLSCGYIQANWELIKDTYRPPNLFLIESSPKRY
jgi:uncharacterized cysteine cluster protein YcgN (CxxCxxCC family)